MTTWLQIEDIIVTLSSGFVGPNHSSPLQEVLSQTLKIIAIFYIFFHHYNNFRTLQNSSDWVDDSQKSGTWPPNYFISFSWSPTRKLVICKTMNSCRKHSVHFLLLWIFLDSWNHSILHVVIDFRDHLLPASAESTVNTELIAGAQGLVRQDLKTLMDKNSTDFLCNLLQCLIILFPLGQSLLIYVHKSHFRWFMGIGSYLPVKHFIKQSWPCFLITTS